MKVIPWIGISYSHEFSVFSSEKPHIIPSRSHLTLIMPGFILSLLQSQRTVVIAAVFRLFFFCFRFDYLDKLCPRARDKQNRHWPSRK